MKKAVTLDEVRTSHREMNYAPPRLDEAQRARAGRAGTGAREADARATLPRLGLGVTALLGVGAGAAFALGVIPAPRKTRRPRQRIHGSASTPPTASPPTASPPTASPPIEYPVTADQPASRYGLDCSTLVDPPCVGPLHDRSRRGGSDPLGVGVGIAIPRRAAILAVGGSVCEWSNGVPMNDQYGVGPDYVGVTIRSSRGRRGWSEYATQHGMPADERQCAARGAGELPRRRRLGHPLGIRRRRIRHGCRAGSRSSTRPSPRWRGRTGRRATVTSG